MRSGGGADIPVYADPPCKAACYAVGTCVEAKVPPGPPESECMDDSDCEPEEKCEFESWCPPCVEEDPPCLAPCYAYGVCK